MSTPSFSCRRKMEDSTTYDRVILIDLQPFPEFPHASCESIDKYDMETVAGGRLKLSRNFRLRPISIKIYQEPHVYHIVSKVDIRCSNVERARATGAVNAHIRKLKKNMMPMDDIVKSVVETFPARVIRGLNFAENNAPMSKFATSARMRPPTQFSSSETDAAGSSTQQARRKKASRTAQNITHCEANEAAALPHNGDPRTPFTVVVPNANATALQDVPDYTNLINEAEFSFEVADDDMGTKSDNARGQENTDPQNNNKGNNVTDPQNETDLTNVLVPPPKKKRCSEDDVKGFHHRLDRMQSQVNASLDRVHKALVFLTGETEKFRKEYQVIRQRLDNVTKTTVVEDMKPQALPFKSIEAMETYVANEPDMTQLIERLVTTSIAQTR